MNVVFKQANASNFKTGRTDSIKYIVIHYTSNNGDTAKNNVDYYAGNGIGSSAHYFVDEYDNIYQSVKDTDTAWAVGASKYAHPYCRNANSISIELCSRNCNGSGKPASDHGWYFKEQTEKNGAELTKTLMAMYGVPAENVLRHYDVTGKICPAPFVNNPKDWEAFKGLLKTNKYSYDDTVNNMILDGITTVDNMQYWEKVLDGREKVDLKNLRTILNRYHAKAN